MKIHDKVRYQHKEAIITQMYDDKAVIHYYGGSRLVDQSELKEINHITFEMVLSILLLVVLAVLSFS